MRLLEAALARSARRLSVEQRLLLLVRMALLAALALAMARPLVTGIGGPPAAPASALALVVDDSRSTALAGRFEQIRREAEALLARADGGAAAVLIFAGEAPRSVLGPAGSDRRRLLEALRSAAPDRGRARLAAALDAAALALAEGGARDADVWVLADRQRINWPDDEREAIRRAVDALRAGGRSARVRWWAPPGAGRVEGGAGLVSIADLGIPGELVGAGETASIRVALRAWGGAAPPASRVRLLLDGAAPDAAETKAVALAPDGAAAVTFERGFPEAGSHWLEAQVLDASEAVVDRAFASIEVRERLRVAIFSPWSSRERSRLDYLSLALAPHESDAAAAGRDLFRTELRGADELAAMRRGDADAAMLAGAASISEEAARALEAFVGAGGGLLIFAADGADVPSWERWLWRGGKGLLPANPLAALGGPPQGGAAAGIEVVEPPHAAVAELASADLALVAARRWMRFEAAAAPGDGAEPTNVLLRLAGGDPFLLERRFGAGRVMLCAAPPDESWSNWPLRAAWVPFIQGMALHLAAAAGPRRNLRAGETLALRLPRDLAGTSVALRLPDGAAVEGLAIERDGAAVFEYRETWLPGLYTARAASTPALHFAVRRAEAEWETEELPKEDAAEIAGAAGIEIIDGAAAGAAPERDRQLELFKPLIAAALALALLELLLAQRLEGATRR
jgi:hypothetical protein